MESVKFAAPVDTAEDWKKKKNYKPAALFTVLLLGTAFLAGKSYGRNDAAPFVDPINSLLAMGDSMSTLVPKDFKPHNKDCVRGERPKVCKEGNEFWSVVGFPDGSGCVGDIGTTMICAEICVSSVALPFLKMVQDRAPEPKPVPGNCAQNGYFGDTGMTFGLNKATHGLVNAYAQIYTKEE